MEKEIPLSKKIILDAVSGIYCTMHFFDLAEGSCYEIYAFKEVHDMFNQLVKEMDIQTLIHTIVKATTTEEYKSSILEFTNFSTLDERINGNKSISVDFIGAIHGWTRSSFIPITYDEKGHLIQFVYTTRIIDEDKKREEAILARLDYDEKTGFFNRRAFERDVKNIEAEFLSDTLVSVCFDVNNLHNVNMTIRYDAGDELLDGAAQCIKQVFSGKGKIYKIGGDDFCIILKCSFKELVKMFSDFNDAVSNWRGKLVEKLVIAKGCAAHAEFPDLSLLELGKRAERRMFQEKELFYKNQGKTACELQNDSDSIKEIIHNTNMGLFSIELRENYPPGIICDNYVKEIMGFSVNATPEQIYQDWIRGLHPDYVDSVFAGIEKIIIGNLTEIQYPWHSPVSNLNYVRSIGFKDPAFTEGIRINGFLQDITNLIHLQKDSLTGLYTKEHFFQKAEEILAKNPHKDYKIFVSDIEDFKSINEKYGFETSNNLLIYLAKNLKKMAPNLVISGRIEGDRFACLQEMVVLTNQEGLALHNKILENAPVRNVIWKHGFYYTTYDRNVSVQTMCDRAFAALESIKGDYVRLSAAYNKELAEKIHKKQQILENMETSLIKGEFKVYLQPKYDLHSEKTGGAEALIRWIHPEIGFMNPNDFIPVFEQNGFIRKIDHFVLEEVCKTLDRWQNEKKTLVPISVNLSRQDFEWMDLADKIIETVDLYKIDHKYIHFELTESAFSDNPSQIAKTIHRLHEVGFMIELDDFGSGYSSLTSLSEIDFDILKLDMSIIKNDRPNSPRNVLDMCSQIMRQMKFKSVAEGVENKNQLERLKALGCDYIQGYLFSKPISISDFEEYLKKEA